MNHLILDIKRNVSNILQDNFDNKIPGAIYSLIASWPMSRIKFTYDNVLLLDFGGNVEYIYMDSYQIEKHLKACLDLPGALKQ